MSISKSTLKEFAHDYDEWYVKEALTVAVMSNFARKALLAAFSAVLPAIIFAEKADASCQCKQVYKQGYGMVWLCCDNNGMCSYYDSPRWTNC